jgi:hypothetical protein
MFIKSANFAFCDINKGKQKKLKKITVFIKNSLKSHFLEKKAQNRTLSKYNFTKKRF